MSFDRAFASDGFSRSFSCTCVRARSLPADRQASSVAMPSITANFAQSFDILRYHPAQLTFYNEVVLDIICDFVDVRFCQFFCSFVAVDVEFLVVGRAVAVQVIARAVGVDVGVETVADEVAVRVLPFRRVEREGVPGVGRAVVVVAAGFIRAPLIRRVACKNALRRFRVRSGRLQLE